MERLALSDGAMACAEQLSVMLMAMVFESGNAGLVTNIQGRGQITVTVDESWLDPDSGKVVFGVRDGDIYYEDLEFGSVF